MEWYHILAMVLGNAALILPLWLWNRTESNADRRDILNLIRGIQDEMKDFHGKLERQDAEFKGKMALQDAEFKAHMLHYHTSKVAQ